MMPVLLTSVLLLTSRASAFSALSSFTGSTLTPPVATTTNSLRMYEDAVDPWSVLTTTERWISQTLADAASAGTSNPYSRKEVTYDCEAATTGPMVLAGIFRRLHELSEQAAHAQRNMRQTVVVVIPGTGLWAQFADFDRLMNTVTQARRNARDYVLLNDDVDDEEETPEFTVSVSCAHMHPQFGEKTPEQQLQELKDEPEEIDLNYQRYQEMKMMARRSPYPSLVMEVKSTPTPDFSKAGPSLAAMQQQKEEEQETKVTAEDIQRLEAIFGATSATSSSEDALGQALRSNLPEITGEPLYVAQHWIAANDPLVAPTAAFTESLTTDVDEAFAYVFTNMAMLMEAKDTNQYYLAMPKFLSATSSEKFCEQVERLTGCLDDVRGKVRMAHFHPEHTDRARRSPFPILSLHKMEQL